MRPGDKLVARCMYSNYGDKPVYFGFNGDDEMCNLFILFKYKPKNDRKPHGNIHCVSNVQKTYGTLRNIPGISRSDNRIIVDKAAKPYRHLSGNTGECV